MRGAWWHGVVLGGFLWALLAPVGSAEEAAPEAAPEPQEVATPEEGAPAAEAETAPEAEDAKPKGDWLSGRFETGMDAAWDGYGSDVELYQVLRLTAKPAGAPKLKLQSSLWLTEDLDGDEARYSTLYGIDDGEGGDVRARVLELYLQASDVLGGAELRVGRQRLLDGPFYNRIDGLRLRWDKPRWDGYVYGGTRASLYEDPFNDLVAGAGLGVRAGQGTRIGVDLYHAEDDRDIDYARGWWRGLFGGRPLDTHVQDQSLALSLHHRFNAYHWMHAELMLHNDGAHEYAMDFTGLIQRWELTYLINYRRQFDRVNDRVNDLTGYYRILGGLEPFHHVHLGLQRPLTQRLTLGVESDIHDASGGYDYGTNRDYVRVATTLSAAGLGKGFGFDLSLDRWNTSGSDGSWIVTGEINRKWKAFEWALGADYEQYRYEFVDYNPWPRWVKNALVLAVPGIYPGFSPLVLLTDTREVVAREEIHSLYSRFAWRINERQRFTARVSYEEDEGPFAPYWQFRASYEIQF